MKFSDAVARLEAHGEYNAIGILTMLRDEKRRKVKRGPTRSQKITETVKNQIHRMHQKGYLNSEIAAELNINQGRVSEVLNGQD